MFRQHTRRQFKSLPLKEVIMFHKSLIVTIAVSLFLLSGAAGVYPADTVQKQLDDVKSVLPKFAIPMREVGDRFQNMYYAAKGDNWGLAFYMSKYMNGAMSPAQLTKPKEYPDWKAFYETTFAPVNKAIVAQDIKAFEKEYATVIESCNSCHTAMGYGFIKVKRLGEPADQGIDYTVKSKATDVPK
jgi:mono/diheme cytochrome c family protein